MSYPCPACGRPHGKVKRAKFIAAYNGPAGVADYWARMQAAIARQSQ